MSTGMKFSIVAFVIVGIVALGWYMAKRKSDQPNAAPPPANGAKTRPDSAFAKTADGKVDYTRNADGSAIRLA